MDAGKGFVEGAIELAEVPEREATQEAAEGCRIGQAMPAEQHLRLVAAQEGDVVKASPPAISVPQRARIACAGL